MMSNFVFKNYDFPPIVHKAIFNDVENYLDFKIKTQCQ